MTCSFVSISLSALILLCFVSFYQEKEMKVRPAGQSNNKAILGI